MRIHYNRKILERFGKNFTGNSKRLPYIRVRSKRVSLYIAENSHWMRILFWALGKYFLKLAFDFDHIFQSIEIWSLILPVSYSNNVAPLITYASLSEADHRNSWLLEFFNTSDDRILIPASRHTFLIKEPTVMSSSTVWEKSPWGSPKGRQLRTVTEMFIVGTLCTYLKEQKNEAIYHSINSDMECNQCTLLYSVCQWNSKVFNFNSELKLDWLLPFIFWRTKIDPLLFIMSYNNLPIEVIL